MNQLPSPFLQELPQDLIIEVRSQPASMDQQPSEQGGALQMASSGPPPRAVAISSQLTTTPIRSSFRNVASASPRISTAKIGSASDIRGSQSVEPHILAGETFDDDSDALSCVFSPKAVSQRSPRSAVKSVATLVDDEELTGIFDSDD
jgi:hypothetical protein